MAGDASQVAKVKSFACAGCGAPLTVRGFGQTESIACGSCGSIVDLADENARVIATARAKVKIEPLIPLGSRGTLLGEKLEVIGYLRRKIVVEGVSYEWAEYVLFNPYKGFRWLNEYNGHWTYIRTLIERPEVFASRPRFLDRAFDHFQTSRAEVTYVLGEFPWRAAVGEKAVIDDYVAPPYVLSQESTDNEIVWSLGQYLEPDVVWGSFGLKTPAPIRVGVGASQPSPHRASASRVYMLFLWFLLAALAVQASAVLLSRKQRVFSDSFVYRPPAAHLQSPETSFVTDVFELGGRTSNVQVKTHADVENSWIYLNLALIDEERGNAYDFAREVSYYTGTDSDGRWHEGSRDDSAIIPSVPPGRYYLRIEPEGGAPSITYSIEVVRDVPQWWWFYAVVAALAVPPLWMWWRCRHFEIQRWAESDHPMVTFESDDDDD